LQQTTRGVQMPSLFRFGCARHLPQMYHLP
jgi:hypothetical protein